jgi:hypothetical protein
MSTGKAAMTMAERHAWRDRNVAELASNEHFTALGVGDGAYFVHHKGLNCLIKLRGCPSPAMLTRIAPLSWWDKHFTIGRSAKFDRLEALDFLFRLCRKAGPYLDWPHDGATP